MRGIFAYLGHRENAAEFVIAGLRRLEYRGYDSWGVAYPEGDKLGVYRKIHVSTEKN